MSQDKHHVLAFGRMNPVTSGHEAVVNKIHSVAKEHNADHTLVVSHSQDKKKNPLSPEQKVKHAKNAFKGTNIKAASKESPTILHHAAELHKQGVNHLHVVAGSDRHEEMHNLLHKYNGKDSSHGHYNFKSITVHSSGERDPDAEGTTGMSASKMREHAVSGNKAEFHKGAPSKMSTKHKDAMYHDVRKGLDINEAKLSYKDLIEAKLSGADKFRRHLDDLAKKRKEGRGLADKYWSIAQDRKETADQSTKGTEKYHTHMADHHDHMSRYHEELGQHSHAQAHADKAEIHHEKAYEASKGIKEAHKVGDKVIIHKGPRDVIGKVGHIGEIRKPWVGAEARYTIDHDEGSIQLMKHHIKKYKEPVKEEVEQIEEKNWIAGAIKHPGALTRAAKRAGETTSEYEQEHKHDSGKTGARARLALTLKKFHKEETILEDHVEFRVDHRDSPKGDVKKTIADHEAKVSDTTDKATYFKVPKHKADSFKTVMKGHGCSAELCEGINLDEVLKPSMGAGEYVKDFQKSDAPQFKGKSKEKRRMMGIAAYLQAQREMQEARQFGSYEQAKAAAAPGQKPKLNPSTNKYILVSEETIQEATVDTKKYSWGTMKTVHHGADFSIPLHPEHHQAIAKLKDEQEHHFKDETGRHWTARRKGSDVHFQGANGGGKTKVKHSTMSEEVEHLEEANHREFASQGKMHPDMAKHMTTGEHMDYYEPKTGDKVHGKVMHNDGKEVHVKQTHDSYNPKKVGTVHKFKVTDKLDEELKQTGPVDTNKVNAAGDKPHEEKWEKAKKVKKESLSFADFINTLQEHQYSDSGTYKHKGTYGSSHVEPDEDEDDKPAKPATEKRGRGRPKGAASGARQVGSTAAKRKSFADYTGYKLHLPNTNK